MSLMDRYVSEVEKRLPRKVATDISAELRSTLRDMLEDRSRAAGRPADEAMEKDLLREYGAPDVVAASYSPRPYLIGPRLYPFFLMVVKIVLSVLTTVLVITTGLQMSGGAPISPTELPAAIGNALTAVISAAIQAFGNIVLVFAILERFVPASEFKLHEEKEWDPDLLTREPEPDRVKPWEPIIAILFTGAALVLFNLYPHIIGLYSLSEGRGAFAPILSDAFFRWMPWINLTWLLEIGLNLILLRQGRWHPSTRLVSLVIQVLQVIVGYFLLTGPSLTAITPEALSAAGPLTVEAARTITALIQQVVRGVILIVILLGALDAGKTIWRLLGARRQAIKANM